MIALKHNLFRDTTCDNNEFPRDKTWHTTSLDNVVANTSGVKTGISNRVHKTDLDY